MFMHSLFGTWSNRILVNVKRTVTVHNVIKRYTCLGLKAGSDKLKYNIYTFVYASKLQLFGNCGKSKPSKCSKKVKKKISLLFLFA